mmetsp:Transcript_16922/g.33074  ORF Transcript_16922/g.33074 Transcript_16922/m.33074 type:complete len:83 (+) Transcript_16922:490-738(+)
MEKLSPFDGFWGIAVMVAAIVVATAAATETATIVQNAGNSCHTQGCQTRGWQRQAQQEGCHRWSKGLKSDQVTEASTDMPHH